MTAYLAAMPEKEIGYYNRAATKSHVAQSAYTSLPQPTKN